MIDQLEEKYGFKIENLNTEEKATFFKMLEEVGKSQLSPEKMRDYIRELKSAVEQQLINEPEFNYIFIFKVPNRKQVMLKARLLNYMLFEAFLSSPERAKEQLEQAIGNVVKTLGQNQI